MDDGSQLLISEQGYREDSAFYHKSDGFYYHFNYATFTTIYFVCASGSCYGRAKLRMGCALEHTQRHNHAPDLLRSVMLGERRNIVNQARAMTYVSFAEIIRQERSRINDREIRSRLTYRCLRPAMQRSRGSVFPRIPANLRELTAIHQDPAWAHLTRTTDLQDSIYSGSADAVDGSHSIIYCSERNLQHLRQVPIIFGDGTFFISPSVDNCYQVFTIVSVHGHTVIPLVWCLMEKKTEAAYVSVFVHLRVRLGHWNFNRAVCDFEDAMINAFRRVFEVEVQGCYYHYVSLLAILKLHTELYLQDLGKWVKSNIFHMFLTIFHELEEIIRCCCALPLLPRHLLQRGFMVIVQEALDLGLFICMHILPFLLYVQTSWINHANRGQTLSVCGSDHRTNNASESNNHRMNSQVQRAHPNIFHLLHVVIGFEDTTVDDLNSLDRGRVPTRHRKCHSISNDETIISLTAQLMQVPVPTDDQLSTFLHSVAFTMENVLQEALVIENPRLQ